MQERSEGRRPRQESTTGKQIKTFNENLILLFFIQDSSREALHKSVSKYLFAQEKKQKHILLETHIVRKEYCLM